MADDEIDEKTGSVWAVVYSNYEPPEVVALYDNEQAAIEHVETVDEPLRHFRWRVRSEYRPDSQES